MANGLRRILTTAVNQLSPEPSPRASLKITWLPFAHGNRAKHASLFHKAMFSGACSVESLAKLQKDRKPKCVNKCEMPYCLALSLEAYGVVIANVS